MDSISKRILHPSRPCVQMKSILKDEEAVASDVVGQAHIETVALKLFEFADTEDRNARFSKYAQNTCISILYHLTIVYFLIGV